ncbi:MAG: GAF domain-containing protein [Desulfobacterales bacterium]
MATQNNLHPFRSVLSLTPLIDFWKTRLTSKYSRIADMFDGIFRRIEQTPALQGTIEDPKILVEYQIDILMPLMSIIFPYATWEHEIAGALKPFENIPFYGSPEFNRLMVGTDGHLLGRSFAGTEYHCLLSGYILILNQIYGFHQEPDKSFVLKIQDIKSGLWRYFRIIRDIQFITVVPLGQPLVLTAEQRKTIQENITDLQVLSEYIPSGQFEFHGFMVYRALEVTESEVISELEKDLIDQKSIFSADGFDRLQQRLQILFGRSDIAAEIAAVQGDRIMVINSMRYNAKSEHNCLFRNSSHIPIAQFKGSVWRQAVEKGEAIRIPDLSDKTPIRPSEKSVLDAGFRSMIIAPLYYQEKIIGTFEIMSPRAGDLTPMDLIRVNQVAPLFSISLKRGLDEMNNEIQSIIKEKCTAVHPSVEWRFRRAAVQHMERLHRGISSEMEPIVFQNVVPLYGQADIRGSSDARNRSIQADLTSQLNLAREVIHWAYKAKSWPLLGEYQYRIENRISRIAQGISSDDEISVTQFLRRDVEPTFKTLTGLGPRVVNAIEQYNNALDPESGVVYHQRKEYEQSISLLTERLSAYVDQQQVEAQRILPHYFEKHKTDGVDYIIYLGASMREDGVLNPFYIKNLGLWQLLTACGMARQAGLIKPDLKVPLNISHLILYNKTPFSIRFRYDEKRFDVDGAYDVRHEIIKSRLDKAMVKNRNERLTQPDRIAIVFGRTDERKEIVKHIEFLQARKNLLNDLEFLDLEDLPGVRGLKALRVGINLEDESLALPDLNIKTAV